MKDYSKIISFMASTPWMMHPPAMTLMLRLLDDHIAGNSTQEDIRARVAAATGSKPAKLDVSRKGSVGVLNLEGPMFPKANMMTELSGATSLEQFQSELSAMLADDSIDSIMLNIDSPGGSSALVAETAAQIRAGNEVKPIYGLANTSANSAAYWLLSQCEGAFATPSGQVGSLGTYFVHTDDSKQMEMRGVKDTVIKAGKYKAITMEPLTPESEAELQDYVNQVNDGFINSVAEGRNLHSGYVRDNFGEGMIFTPGKATAIGMIDGVYTYDQVMNFATNTTNVGGGPGLQQSYDADKEHAEPGTGQPPVPRTPPEEGDPAIVGGWRRDPPPPAYEPVETEAHVVNREWLEARAEALGVLYDGANTSDEDLAVGVQEAIDAIVVPLATATASAVANRQFEEDYPEQAAQLRTLTETTRLREADEFASQFERIEGTSQGYAPVVRDEIRTAYAAISARQFTPDMLKSLLDVVGKPEAKVTYGELGSSRQTETSAMGVPTDFVEARKLFADLVAQAMEEDHLDQNTAMEHVAKQNPDLARAYAIGHVGH